MSKDNETKPTPVWTNLKATLRERRAKQQQHIDDALLKQEATSCSRGLQEASEARNDFYTKGMDLAIRSPAALSYFTPEQAKAIATKLELADDGTFTLAVSDVHKRALRAWLRRRAWEIFKWLVGGTGAGALGHWLHDFIKAATHGH